MAKERCRGVIGCISLFSMVWGRGQETADRVLASQGASHAGREEGPPNSEPHGLKAGQEAEQDGGGAVAGLPGATLPPP